MEMNMCSKEDFKKAVMEVPELLRNAIIHMLVSLYPDDYTYNRFDGFSMDISGLHVVSGICLSMSGLDGAQENCYKIAKVRWNGTQRGKLMYSVYKETIRRIREESKGNYEMDLVTLARLYQRLQGEYLFNQSRNKAVHIDKSAKEENDGEINTLYELMQYMMRNNTKAIKGEYLENVLAKNGWVKMRTLYSVCNDGKLVLRRDRMKGLVIKDMQQIQSLLDAEEIVTDIQDSFGLPYVEIKKTAKEKGMKFNDCLKEYIMDKFMCSEEVAGHVVSHKVLLF